MTIAPPSPLLAAACALVPAIRAAADAIDHEGQLPAALLDVLHDAGLLRLGLPVALGGGEEDPLTISRIIEELAAADGSVGWVVMVASQTAMLSVTWSPAVQQAVFADPRAVVANGAPAAGHPQRAALVAGGYRVSGRWSFASGVRHATWFAPVATLSDGDTPRLGEAGWPQLRACLVPVKDCTICTILDTWHVTGLRGTGSTDVELHDVFVPDAFVMARMVTLPPQLPGPLYASKAFIPAGHGAQALGVARHAYVAFLELAGHKTPATTTQLLRDQPHVQAELARVRALLQAADRYYYGTLADLWARLKAGEAPALDQRAELYLATAHAATSACEAVDRLHTLAGTSALYETSPLERCFRDLHAAAPHFFVGQQAYLGVGRLTVGLDSGIPYLQ